MPEITDRVDTFLEHHGIKGMKWGVHRSARQPTKVRTTAAPGRRVKARGGTGQKPHDDAVKAAILKQKAKKSSPDSLSNKELKLLVERMNLEKQYSTLKPPSKGSRAAKFVSSILVSTGKQQASKVASDFAGKALANALEGVVKINVK
jgi:hypothetical protein